MRITTAHESVHVGAADLLDRGDRCPICGDAAARKPIVRLQRDPDVWFLACRRCRGSSASHMPTDAFLDRYYSRYHDGRNARVTFSDAERFAHGVAESLPVVSKSMRLLDFGGGDGTLALSVARLLDAEIDITVVDWGDAAASPDPRIRIASVRTLVDAHGEYDVVLASAVLEHIPDLHSLLPELVNKVRRGGTLYVRTPYVVPLRKLIPLDVGYPAHVHDLGGDFWRTLPEWFPSPMRTIASRPSPVAASWRHEPLRALAAHAMKAPARIIASWPFVGGWEVLLERAS